MLKKILLMLPIFVVIKSSELITMINNNENDLVISDKIHLDRLDVNAKNEIGQTALMAACEKGNFNLVNTLLQSGANVNAQDNNGMTSMMYASRSGKSLLIDLLASRGANELITDNYGKKAYDYASTDLVRALLSNPFRSARVNFNQS